MSHYQHILLAVDYSPHSELVARKAHAFARCYQAKLSLVHVLDNIPMPDTPYGTVISLDNDSFYALLEAEKAKLVAFAERFKIDRANAWLIWGIPKQEIVQLAQSEQVDLIIMGSHGRHGLALLLGSTTNSVLHYSQCDVLAVRLHNE